MPMVRDDHIWEQVGKKPSSQAKDTQFGQHCCRWSAFGILYLQNNLGCYLQTTRK